MKTKKTKVKFNPYRPVGTLEDYKEAIQILLVDYADVWSEKIYKEVDKKLRKLGI